MCSVVIVLVMVNPEASEGHADYTKDANASDCTLKPF